MNLRDASGGEFNVGGVYSADFSIAAADGELIPDSTIGTSN